MLICHCERVNDQKIRQAVENGARTVGQVGRICGAGTCCGGCVRAIAEIVEESDAPAAELGHLPERPSPARRQRLPIAAE